MGSRPDVPAPRARPRIACSSRTVSKTLAGPNLFHQPARDAVDAALAGDVLAEDQCFRVVGEDVEQGAVDGLCQRQRAVVAVLPATLAPRRAGSGVALTASRRASRRGFITARALSSWGSSLTSRARPMTSVRLSS